MTLLDTSHAIWRKSRRSNNEGGACVEVAPVGDRCLVRDSKNPTGPALAFTSPEWDRFLGQIKTDHLNLP
ncbi:MAG: hypothetical protein JWN52_7790 [Actinomycetia bacterium]|jgi:hypothetical protein|nr:hypothetical protein [Actinomycetes bacterium]